MVLSSRQCLCRPLVVGDCAALSRMAPCSSREHDPSSCFGLARTSVVVTNLTRSLSLCVRLARLDALDIVVLVRRTGNLMLLVRRKRCDELFVTN